MESYFSPFVRKIPISPNDSSLYNVFHIFVCPLIIPLQLIGVLPFQHLRESVLKDKILILHQLRILAGLYWVFGN
jgi:hypothetical protein